MPQRKSLEPTAKLAQIQKDFQQIASMAGFLNSAFDLPQLRLMFTLYARITVPDAEAGAALTPKMQAWCERLSVAMREGSSSAILPPQINIAPPQPLPNGEAWSLVGTLQFATKVTENSYTRVRSAVLAAYQSAVALREKGAPGLEAPLADIQETPIS